MSGFTKLVFGALLIVGFSAQAKAADWGLFGSKESKVGATSEYLALSRFMRLMPDFSGFEDDDRRDWVRLVDQISNMSIKARLRAVQEFFSHIPYHSDQELFGRADYWAPVGQFLAKGGDCEDFVLAKYRALAESGYDIEQMRVVLVVDAATGLDHAVLAVRVDNLIYILDNRTEALRLHRDVRQYQPLYSLNANSLFLHSGTRIVESNDRAIVVNSNSVTP